MAFIVNHIWQEQSFITKFRQPVVHPLKLFFLFIRLSGLLSVGIGCFSFAYVGFQFRHHFAIAYLHLHSGCAFEVGEIRHIFCDWLVLKLCFVLLCMDNALE